MTSSRFLATSSARLNRITWRSAFAPNILSLSCSPYTKHNQKISQPKKQDNNKSSIFTSDTGSDRLQFVKQALKTKPMFTPFRLRAINAFWIRLFRLRKYCKLKPGFHYPSSRPELTARVDGWPVSTTRVDGPCWRVMETGHPSTRAVNSGSGNWALVEILIFTIINLIFKYNWYDAMHLCSAHYKCHWWWQWVDDDDDDDDDEDTAEKTSSTTCPTVDRSGPCQSWRTLEISCVLTTCSWRAFISLIRAATDFIDSTATEMTSQSRDRSSRSTMCCTAIRQRVNVKRHAYQ